MITDVYIIRPKDNMNTFFEIDPDTGNWNWTNNLESATIFQTSEKAENMIAQKIPNIGAYVYQIPYSIIQPQTRKKKTVKKVVKRKIKRVTKKKIKRGK